MADKKVNTMLGPYRALDLTDNKGFLCGKILGDLGMDVIKVEPPMGDPSRNIGPYYHDIIDPEKSLFWWGLNNNKRGITLDYTTVTGRELFKKLIKTADLVIESFEPGYLDSLGIGYEAMSKINKGIIYVSITAWGMSGPYKDWKGGDLVAHAASGYMWSISDPTDYSRAPLEPGLPVTFYRANLVASNGAVVALYAREVTGEGQQVDVSAAQSAQIMPVLQPIIYQMQGNISSRTISMGGGTGRYIMPTEWECKDGGFISLAILGGVFGLNNNMGLSKWFLEEGLGNEMHKTIDWKNWNPDTPEVDQPYMDKLFKNPLIALCKKYTMWEFFDTAKGRGVQCSPVGNAQSCYESPQLKVRDFFVEVDHHELGESILYPGTFIKSSECPITIWRRAPLIGEHNEDIYVNELGISRQIMSDMVQANII